MKILITGAGGFVGGQVARQAVADGHGVATLTRGGHGIHGALNFKGSIEAPPWEDIRAFAPDVCIHCAWIATPGIYLDSPENDRLVDDSMDFASRLAQSGLRHFIGTGTCFEYAPSPHPLPTNAPPPLQLSPYAAAKIRLRHQLAGLFPNRESGACLFSWGRIFYAYGPDEHPKRFPSILLRNFAEGLPVTVNRPHDIVDYIHVRDIAAAFLTITTSSTGGDFNIGSGVPVTVGDLAVTAARLAGREDLLVVGRHDDVTARFADMDCWKNLSWKPRFQLEEGLREMLNP